MWETCASEMKLVYNVNSGRHQEMTRLTDAELEWQESSKGRNDAACTSTRSTMLWPNEKCGDLQQQSTQRQA